MIRLHEAPLEVLTQLGASKLLGAIRQGLVTLHAPQVYLDLVQQIQANPGAIRSLSPAQFGEWAAGRVKTIDLNSPIFRTMVVTLTEADFLNRPV